MRSEVACVRLPHRSLPQTPSHASLTLASMLSCAQPRPLAAGRPSAQQRRAERCFRVASYLESKGTAAATAPPPPKVRLRALDGLPGRRSSPAPGLGRERRRGRLAAPAAGRRRPASWAPKQHLAPEFSAHDVIRMPAAALLPSAAWARHVPALSPRPAAPAALPARFVASPHRPALHPSFTRRPPTSWRR